MPDLNTVMLLGRLTRDPTLKYVNGTPKCEFRLATSRHWKAKDGEKKEETLYVSVVVWARSAESCKQFLQAGREAFVEGYLKFEEWEKDGQRRSKHLVVANQVQFLGGGQSQQNTSQDTDREHARSGGQAESSPGAHQDLPF